MPSITIPKKLTKQGDLVVIPRREYEEFSRWRKTVKINLRDRWFWTAEWQKKEAEADTAIHPGKLHGPFYDSKSLLLSLKRKRK